MSQRNDLATASCTGYGSEKSRPSFWHIKRSIMYKIEEGLLFLFPWCTYRNAVFGSGQGQKSPPGRVGGGPVQGDSKRRLPLEEEAARMGSASGWKWIWTSTCEGLHKQNKLSEAMGDILPVGVR